MRAGLFIRSLVNGRDKDDWSARKVVGDRPGDRDQTTDYACRGRHLGYLGTRVQFPPPPLLKTPGDLSKVTRRFSFPLMAQWYEEEIAPPQNKQEIN